jgi:hypothetical protein
VEHSRSSEIDNRAGSEKNPQAFMETESSLSCQNNLPLEPALSQMKKPTQSHS